MRSSRPSKRSASPSPEDLPKKRSRTKGPSEKGDETASDVGPRTRRTRGIVGKLSLIMNMPNDVIIEIFCHLHPEDLLSIARTSKTWRTILMSKSSICIWKAAEQSLGMPPCPPDISNPRYASLLLERICTHCGGHCRRTVDIQARARLCTKCEKEMKLEGKSLANVKCEFSGAIESWLRKRREDVLRQKEDLKQMRRASIYRRLDDLGYTQDDYSAVEWDHDKCKKWCALVNNSQNLTDEGWRKIRPQLEELILLYREEKHQTARKQCFFSRLQAICEFALSVLHESKLLWSRTELMQHPGVLNILNADGLETTISEGDLEIIKGIVLEHGSKRKQEQIELCGAAMVTAFAECGLPLPGAKAGESAEDKPSRQWPISASNILEHSCAFFEKKVHNIGTFALGAIETFDRIASGLQPGDPQNLLDLYAPDTGTIVAAKNLAEGLNIAHLSLSELDLRGNTFVCARCDDSRTIMNWRKLVVHFHYLSSASASHRPIVNYLVKVTGLVIGEDKHSLEDDSLGVSAIDLSSIDDVQIQAITDSDTQDTNDFLVMSCGLVKKDSNVLEWNRNICKSR